MITKLVVSILIIFGALLCLIASIGILRFQDIYNRIHAASKVGTLGVGLLLIALAIYSNNIEITIKVILSIIFLMLTIPISTHLLAKSSIIIGIKTCNKTIINTLKNKRMN